ncbi:uncharacterized protein LAJ45_01249 [Morchella importuna]|nr:uncharacterized protein LAJ45_01249 [Morchella importuna]KAH8154718.1 hypothetical protein LAJ45_01249 [Morchella importuna]
MNGFHTLPHELQIQVLLHLPPTAVFALRSVCTSWNEILSSPQIEHAINLSLLFPTTAPDLRARLLRRTRLLRGDPVQIWDVDDGEETLTLYSEGFVVMAHSRFGGPGRLGIWDCRRPKGQDGCVTRIDLTALVKELYLELWEGRILGAGETDEEGGGQSGGDRRAEIPFRLMTHYSWAENGSVLLVLGEPGNPRKPKHPKIFLLFSLATGDLIRSWKVSFAGRVISAHFTSTILLLVTSLPQSLDICDDLLHHITTYSISTGAQLYTQPIPSIELPAPPSYPPGSAWCHAPTATYYHNHITLDDADNFYTPEVQTNAKGPRYHVYEARSAHTGTLTATISLSPVNEAVAASNHWRYDSTIVTCPSSRVHHFSTYKPHPETLADLSLSPGEERDIYSTTYTNWNSTTLSRRTSLILPPLDGYNIAGTDAPEMTSYLSSVRWGVAVGDYYHFGKRCWVYNVSGANEEVVTGATIPDATEGLRRCAPLACYLPSTPLDQHLHSPTGSSPKSWRRFKMLLKAFGVRPPAGAVGESIILGDEEPPCRTHSPTLPEGVVCRWLPEVLREATVVGGDDGVWAVAVSSDEGGRRAKRRVWISWDEGLRLPGRGWARW